MRSASTKPSQRRPVGHNGKTSQQRCPRPLPCPKNNETPLNTPSKKGCSYKTTMSSQAPLLISLINIVEAKTICTT